MDAPPVLQFNEALKDSPHFRIALRRHEKYLSDVEGKIRDVIRLCSTMVEFGKSFVAAFFNLMTGVKDLCDDCLRTDFAVDSLFKDLTDAYAEIIKYQKVLVEQAHWTIIKNLSEFLRRLEEHNSKMGRSQRGETFLKTRRVLGARCLREMGKVQEVRSHFERVSGSLDEALTRNAQVPKHKEQEAHEARNELTAVGTCFAHTALDYVFQLNLIQSRKNHELIEAFLSFLRACQTHFHQGHDMFENPLHIHPPPPPADLRGEEEGEEGDSPKGPRAPEHTTKIQLLLSPDALTSLKQKSRQIERKMQDRHMLVPKFQEIFQHPLSMPSRDAMMEGYLFKRATNAFKTWNRRWFVVRDGQLLYCHRDLELGPGEKKDHHSHKLTEDGYTVMEADLRLCLVRAAPNNFERLNCFELVTPTKSHMLQADSQKLCDTWISTLQKAIQASIQEAQPLRVEGSPGLQRMGSETSQRQNGSALFSPNTNTGGNSPQENRNRPIDEIKNVPGNDFCADCGSPNPKWASINIGVTICIECGGIHRSLGVQHSKVRSLVLDAWESENIRLMKSLGNDNVNKAYLAHYTQDSLPSKPSPQSGRPQKELWIKAKYIDRCFARSPAERIVGDAPKHKMWPVSSDSKGTPSPQSQKKQLRADRAKSVGNVDEMNDSGPMDGSGDASVPPPSPLTQTSFRIVKSNPDIHAAMEHSDILPRIGDSINTGSRSTGSEPMLDQLENISGGVDMQNVELIEAACKGDVARMCFCIARGANVNSFEATRERGLTTPLHQSMISGSSEASEYLLLNGAKVNVLDAHQQTPLHLACLHGHTNQVVQLLKRRALQDMQNREGKTPLDIAVDAANADMVTVLRLQKLKDDMADSDVMYPSSEDPFGDIFTDIQEMTTNNSNTSTTSRQDSDSVVNL